MAEDGNRDLLPMPLPSDSAEEYEQLVDTMEEVARQDSGNPFFLSFFPADLLAHGASGQRTIVSSISEKYRSWFETKLNYTTLPT